MSISYSTTVATVGGRNGTATSDDGRLALRLAIPRELGGKGEGTNPEQLFAAGYAGCFGSAVIHVARGREKKIGDGDVEVAATIGLRQHQEGQFGLTAALIVTIAGIDQAAAEAIVAEAHRTCPYSRAVRGNVEVALTVRTR